MQEEFAAFVGIDWADRKHDICLQVPGTDAVEASVLEHRPKAIEEWPTSCATASPASASRRA
jgi:hypothetical protein